MAEAQVQVFTRSDSVRRQVSIFADFIALFEVIVAQAKVIIVNHQQGVHTRCDVAAGTISREVERSQSLLVLFEYPLRVLIEVVGEPTERK
jgi:hypothetical protein